MSTSYVRMPNLRRACCAWPMQVKTLAYWGGTSFLFSAFKWFFAATSTTGVSCGFSSWPSLGMDALNYNWQFDFELNYIGVGAR